MVQYRPQKWARVQEQHSVSTLGKPGCPADFEGPFRSNIWSFVHDFAHSDVPNALALSSPDIRAWTLPLCSENGTPLLLYILEETTTFSSMLHCDRCRILGWAHHPVCKKRYHFIISNTELKESSSVGKGRKLCLGCSCVIPASTKMCPGCGFGTMRSKILEAHTHLLHGVIHANGYGHLLRVNGREGGSHILSGREIMDLWDRLCTMLRARKISVMDVSRKYNLEFRLLHAIAYGHCWYGRWGYSFGKGSFNISLEHYANTLLTISLAPLKKFANSVDKEFSQIVSLYQKLSKPSPINTVGQLIQVIIEQINRLHEENFTSKKYTSSEAYLSDRMTINVTNSTACRWPTKRLEQAQEALLTILRASDNATWLSRQILRESARSHIGDTGLLDFVLKGFVDKIIGHEIVRRRINQRTRMLEYWLEHLDDNYKKGQDHISTYHFRTTVDPNKPKYEEIVQHLAFVYHVVLRAMPEDAQVLLDVKQLIKDYMGEFTRDQYEFNFAREHVDEPFRILCYLCPKDNGDKKIPPSELVVLPPNATIGDLKRCAEKAFREVYLSFEKFQVLCIPKLEGFEDGQELSTIANFKHPLCLLDIEGTGIDEISPARHEAGTEEWVVNCHCGTKDDDGERMAECGLCKIWQHTRCAGIQDFESVPQQFMCNLCCLLGWPSGHGEEVEPRCPTQNQQHNNILPLLI